MAEINQLESILEALEQADALAGLQTVTESLQVHYNIEHIAYHWVDSKGDQAGCGTYSLAWQERYMAQEYLRIDPVISGCFQRFHPVEWKQLDWSSRAVRAFAEDAAAHGIGTQGYSVPVRGPNGQFALFTANHTCGDDTWAQFIETHRRDMILFAHLMNEKALELDPHRAQKTAQALSPREVDAMTYLAIGYSRAQVANELSISEHTLRVYIESARFKLGALNTTHAVARALSQGLIVV
ncbi:helix-turn-helix transcriptional regulator [Sulfitobacter sp. JB4-11]|uniref:helix-turn-helix transcriptional regulator n=1 Tax=Sulfitobacter rhodophyticola TaxID=3238304 RepID=UPI003516E255